MFYFNLFRWSVKYVCMYIYIYIYIYIHINSRWWLMTLPLYVQECSRVPSMKRELIRTEQEPIRTHQESTRTTQESTRKRLFIQGSDFSWICLHQPQYCFCLPYKNEGGFHLACMRSMSSWENTMVISYYFHQPVSTGGCRAKITGKNCFMKMCSGVGRRLTFCHVFLPTSKYASEIKNCHNDFESSHISV